MEHVLIGLIVVLAVWGIGVQVMIRRVVKEEKSLGESDEERLAAEISKIEEELVAQYTAQQIDVWAPNDGSDAENATEAEDETIDPNQAPHTIRDMHAYPMHVYPKAPCTFHGMRWHIHSSPCDGSLCSTQF